MDEAVSESPPRQKRKRSRARYDDIDRYLQNKYRSIIPGAKMNKMRSRLQNKIKSIIEDNLPNVTVVPYGSTTAGVAVKSSDIDITVITENNDMGAVVKKAAEVLKKEGGIDDMRLFNAGKWWAILGKDKSSDTRIDLTFNNVTGVMDSDFVRSVVDVNMTIRIFLTLIKGYSKCHKISDSREGTLKSIGYIYMGIYHLQRIGEMSKFLGTETVAAIVAEVQKFKVGSEKTSQDSINSSIGQLFGSFFRYYSEDHDFGTYAISVLGGKVVEKSYLGWVNDEKYTLAIVDPFGAENIGRSVDRNGLKAIIKSFKEAHSIIASERRPHRLFKLFDFERRKL